MRSIAVFTVLACTFSTHVAGLWWNNRFDQYASGADVVKANPEIKEGNFAFFRTWAIKPIPPPGPSEWGALSDALTIELGYEHRAYVAGTYSVKNGKPAFEGLSCDLTAGPPPKGKEMDGERTSSRCIPYVHDSKSWLTYKNPLDDVTTAKIEAARMKANPRGKLYNMKTYHCGTFADDMLKLTSSRGGQTSPGNGDTAINRPNSPPNFYMPGEKGTLISSQSPTSGPQSQIKFPPTQPSTDPNQLHRRTKVRRAFISRSNNRRAQILRRDHQRLALARETFY